MILTEEQFNSVRDIIEMYVINEPEVIRNGHNYGLTKEEMRNRCERWNIIIRIGDDNRMQHLYTEQEIQDLCADLED